MKEFLCSCVNPDFKSLCVKDINEFCDFIDNSNVLSKKRFMQECNLSEEEINDMKQFPYDFSRIKNGNIYFFTHSMIEHFFK